MSTSNPHVTGPGSRHVRLAIGQFSAPQETPDANRERSMDAARIAFDAGANVVVLPELAASGYSHDPDVLDKVAEPLDGPTVRGWRDIAAEASSGAGAGSRYVVGGLCERDGGRLYNTAVIVGADGVVLHYRKLHPFAGEKRVFAPGDLGLPVVDTPLGRLGVCVYDLRFVETVRILALRGAELVVVPTAWLTGFDQQRWDERGLCPQAHGAILQANLNQVFIACASQVGEQESFSFLGSSIVADPNGRLALGPLPGEHEALELVDVDLDQVVAARHRSELITPQADRRTDVYRITIDGVPL